MWNIDRVLVLSEFMRRQYRDAFGLPEEILLQTRNGVDLSLWWCGRRATAARRSAVNRKRLVFAARPERGLDVLLGKVFPAVLAARPGCKARPGAYDNPVDHLAEFYAGCAAAPRRVRGPDRGIRRADEARAVPALPRLGRLRVPDAVADHAELRGGVLHLGHGSHGLRTAAGGVQPRRAEGDHRRPGREDGGLTAPDRYRTRTWPSSSIKHRAAADRRARAQLRLRGGLKRAKGLDWRAWPSSGPRKPSARSETSQATAFPSPGTSTGAPTS
jgi:hypothetical protein